MMNMNQKKKQERKEYKISPSMYLMEGACLIMAGVGISLISLVRHVSMDVLVRNLILGLAGIAVLGFEVRQAYLFEELDYDNQEHYLRFWICFFLGMAVAFACAFLPPGGWPYLPIYVLLALFGNMSAGILGASVLLMISTLLSEVTLGIAFLYFLSGIFAITLFRKLTKDFKIGIRMFLSLLCLLLCETEGTVLMANERLNPEFLIMPFANVILSGILLLGVLKFFSSIVIYRDRIRYLELSDTENEVLSAYRTEAKNEYMHSVHTAYFCERIAARLLLDEEALKCAGYYHKVCAAHPDTLEQLEFPTCALEILKEYTSHKNSIKKKETAVLLCADTVMSAIQYLVDKSKGQGIQYDSVIDAVFQRFDETNAFLECDISLKELNQIKNIFKEEKLYYDFLR